MVAVDSLVVDFARKSDVLKLYPEALLLSSDQAGWDRIQLQYHQHPPHKLSENCSKQHRIIIHDRRPSPPFVEEMLEHRFHSSYFGNGDVALVPANMLVSASWNIEYQFITLSFESSTFARHTFDLTNITDDVELVPIFSKPDLTAFCLTSG
jgi:AraC family transcriptional regulator